MNKPHFNNLTPAEAERLAMLAEECGEVIQVIGKILRHGYESCHPVSGERNRDRLQAEVTDVLAVLVLMTGTPSDITLGDIKDERYAVWRKLRYSHHQPGSPQ